MTMHDHAAIEELLAVDALDGLDDRDRADLDRMLAEHGDCAECRALEAGFRETAAAIGASLDPVGVNRAVADAIVGGGRASTEAGPAGDAGTPRRSGRWMTAVAIAAVIALLGAFLALRDRSTPAATVNWAQRVVTFEGGSGELAMAYVPGRSGVMFWGEDVPQPDAGHTLEIWMIEGDEVVRGACVMPTDGRIASFLDADVGSAEVMAVTVEPTSCPDQPSTEPIFTAQLA